MIDLSGGNMGANAGAAALALGGLLAKNLCVTGTSGFNVQTGGRGAHEIAISNPKPINLLGMRKTMISLKQGTAGEKMAALTAAGVKVVRSPADMGAAIKEMHRQMGDSLQFDVDGLLRRGLLIRLLVLPNDMAGIAENLRWIRDELSPKTAISLMAQYYATNKAATDDRYILLSRRISEGEWFEAVSLLEDLGMEEGFMQEYESASYYYRPDFTDADKPFKDIRDFS